jgi:tetratricopeptide (TPR) repeat protein
VASHARDLADAEEAFRRGDLPRAARLLKRVLLAAPAHSRAHEVMAYVEGRRGNLEAALSHLRDATRLPGASATAWYYLGVGCRKEGRHADAAAAFGKALDADPNLLAAAHDLGLSRFDLGDPLGALEAYGRALEIAPDSFEASHNMGRALHALGRFEEALEWYDKALAMRPESVPTWLNRGEALNDLRRYPEALADWERASSLSHGNADAEWNESLTRLLLGDLETGWRKYEARWKGRMAWPRRHVDTPAWLGERDPAGMRILVWCEQGLGDTLQFCRYAPLLAARGAEVVFEVQPELKGLLAGLGGCEVFAMGEALPRCDAQVPLLSLPLAFGTTLGTIPAVVPYLHAPPAKLAEWSGRLGDRKGRPRVGIACSGKPSQKDDRYRSASLRDFAPLQELAELFLLQVQVRPEDAAYLLGPGRDIRSFVGEIRDFGDTAGIVANMDLVVTIDTSVAHLAGALARPVWILLPWTPTWRWLTDREDSPWYPTARLFRQQSRGTWDDVVSRVTKALQASARG